MTHRVFLALGFGSHGRGSGLIRIGLFLGLAALPLASQNLVTPTPGAHRVALVQAGERPRLILDAQDYPGVRRAAENLASDLERVTGQHAEISMQTPPSARMAVIIGTLGHSSLIDQLVKARKLDVSKVQGRWEAHVLQVVRKPLPGVENALVIAGSDKRGTIYGIYDVSEQAGVSPWYWWADVPVQHRDALYVEQGKRVDAGPAVKYRGIFLNDEEPALGGWARKTFGGFNSRFYGKVFELILRLKGNYLWPAMWGSAFNEDDPANAALADEMGVVMGTSHHEPMLRAQQEWGRHGSGPWDFTRNAEVLKTFWADGIRRNKNFESLVTVGMRGDGDMPMEEGANVSLLEGIVASQRGILEKEMGKPAAQIPQLWALYKEVQGYFEKGMKVPDDVTLLWCDDNWGNIRRLPTAEERHRSGGAGIYYHFDYVGGPRNYKWLYTMPLAKVWEQMSQAHAFGADRIWIVNVGDLKPMELPIEFFLRLAWNPDAMDAASVPAFVRKWAAREFGAADSAEIAEIVQLYQRFNGRRKPEMLSPDTFSLIHEREAERVVEDWKALEQRAEAVYRRLPKSALDAFDQLVLHPVKACRVVNEMLVTAGFNRLYAEQGRASANRLAARVKELFEEDAQLTKHYHAINGGKWNHFMDQKHLGYTIWQEPPAEVMPAVSEIRMAETPAMAVAIEGTRQAWARDDGYMGAARLPAATAPAPVQRWIDVFNQGKGPFRFQARSEAPWLRVSPASGEVADIQRLTVSVDWSQVPEGAGEGRIKLLCEGTSQFVTVLLPVTKLAAAEKLPIGCFLEDGGRVAIEAAHFDRSVGVNGTQWREIPGYGRTLSGLGVFPLTAASVSKVEEGPFVEYSVYLSRPGDWTASLFIGPSLDCVPGRGLRAALSVDGEKPTLVDFLNDRNGGNWDMAVSNSVRRAQAVVKIAQPGVHKIRVHMVDAGIVLERLELNAPMTFRPSYLGPLESARVLR